MDTRNRAHFILTWTSQLRKVMSMKALPKNRLYWYTKFTPKPTRYTARFTVSKNIKDPPSTVCHSQRWMINPMFSYLKTPDSQNPILSEKSSFWWLKKKISMAFALPIELYLSQLTSSLTFPLLGGGGVEWVAAWRLVLAGLNHDRPFCHPVWGWKGLR